MSTGVSLYVPCYNAGRYIEKCLEGVFNQSRIPDEVIIVDDGSTDDTSEVAKRFPVKLVSHECNKGLAAARNTGVRCAKHELVASIDADCIPKHDWLERLLSCMTSADVAGSGGRLVETNTRALPDRWRTLHMIQHRGPNLIDHSDFLFGHSTLFRKGALERVGLYNESLRTNNEDEYICQRLLGAGYSLVYHPDAVVEHLRTDTLSSLLRTYWRWWFFGYKKDITYGNTLRQMRSHCLTELPALLATDIRARHFDCIVISCLAVGYSIWSDFRYLLAHWGQRRLYDLK